MEGDVVWRRAIDLFTHLKGESFVAATELENFKLLHSYVGVY